jgi:glycosyltransferase involved in cell wall biosynthesis
MKTVLFYLPSDLIGGAEIQTKLLVKNLPRDKFRPVVATVPVHSSGKEFIEDLRTMAPVFDIFSDADLLYVINLFKPDIIQHFHNPTVHAVLKRSGHKCKVVEVVHGRFNFPNDVTKTPKELTDWVVGVSKEAKDFFVKSVPEYGDRTSVILNGIEMSKFGKVSQSREYKREPVSITHVGRLCECDKHITKIIDMCCRMKVPAESWNLRIVGEGADRALIEAHVNKYKSKFNIALLPHTNTPEQSFKNADICVSRSEAEGFGLSIAEAAATGLPVVLWNCGGVANYLTHKVDSVIVKDEGAFVHYLEMLVKDPGLRESLGRNAADTARSTFSDLTMTKNYVELYEKLAGAPALVTVKTNLPRRAAGISNPNFHGVTNATISVVGQDMHIPQLPIQDAYMMRTAAERVLALDPTVLLIGGGGGYSTLVRHLRVKAPKIKLMLVWHGTMSFNSFAPGDAKILAEYFELLKLGVIDRIGFVRPDMHKAFNHPGCVYFPNRVPPKTAGLKVDLGPGFHVGVFGTDYAWKNQIGAISYLGKYPGHDVVIHTNKAPHPALFEAMGIKVVEHGNLPRGAFQGLLGSMDCNAMLSFTESMGLTAIESFRAGVPCIVSSNVRLTSSIYEHLTVKDLDDPNEVWGKMNRAVSYKHTIVPAVNTELNDLDIKNHIIIGEVIKSI